MKKHFLLIAAVAASTFTFAQSKVSFGLKGGVSHATIKGDAMNSLQNLLSFTNGAVTAQGRTGFFGGGFAAIPVSQQFSIEPGLYYTQKGYELRGSLSVKGAEFLSANAKAQLATTYIDVPVLAKANFNGLQLFAGPQFSYLAGAKLRTSAGALGFTIVNSTLDAKNQFNELDVALTGGAGYRFANGFTVSAQYDHGLSKVDKNANLDSYNRGFKVGVGFSF